ncbi:MAG: 3-oxoacyl-ACP synthase III family protein [Bacteroidota bacterium]
MKTKIIGTGTVLPSMIVKNSYFLNSEFYDKEGHKNEKPMAEVIEKLQTITGISERRYIPFDEDSVPFMAETALKTIADAGLQVNDLSGIIVAHNAGNMIVGKKVWHPVPNMAALLKNRINSTNHNCFAYDLLFGCPGWVQGIIQAHQTIQMGEAEHILVVGVEVASRLVDPHDLDSMIFADGCGACIVSKSDEGESAGFISSATFSHANDDITSIYLGESNNESGLAGSCYLHMNGKEVYKYATIWLPQVIKKALDKANLNVDDIDMFLFHQANGKMLAAIANNLASLYGKQNSSFEGKIPTIIEFTGNTSVATIPTMLDLILKNNLEGYQIKSGDKVVFASVGAGMHCNAIIYQF